MKVIKKKIKSTRNFLVLFFKLVFHFPKQIIIYTKKHPIYTSALETKNNSKYLFIYIDITSQHLNWIEKYVIKKAALIHADAISFPNSYSNKRFITECDAGPDNSFFTNAQIKKILVESRSAGGEYFDNGLVSLCYPAIAPPTINKKESTTYTTLLCVGYGGYIKGYDVLYRLYKTLSKTHKIKLIIAGSFNHNFLYYPEVTKEAYERACFGDIYEDLKMDENVIIQPFKRAELLNNIYNRADVYVQFSRMETFGYSILEAMSFGLPVVSTYFKAIPEMIEHNKNGYLIYSNGYNKEVRDYVVDINSKEWGENCYNEALPYLTDLIENISLRNDLGENSLKIVEERFNVSNKISFLNRLYADVIAGP